MRGIDGVPADADRDTGFQEVMAEYPDIEIKEVFTGWDFTKGGDIAVQEFTAADYDGVWTSGIDYTVVNAFETAGKDPVPGRRRRQQRLRQAAPRRHARRSRHEPGRDRRRRHEPSPCRRSTARSPSRPRC